MRMPRRSRRNQAIRPSVHVEVKTAVGVHVAPDQRRHRPRSRVASWPAAIRLDIAQTISAHGVPWAARGQSLASYCCGGRCLQSEDLICASRHRLSSEGWCIALEMSSAVASFAGQGAPPRRSYFAEPRLIPSGVDRPSRCVSPLRNGRRYPSGRGRAKEKPSEGGLATRLCSMA